MHQGRRDAYVDLMRYVTRVINSTERGGHGRRDLVGGLDVEVLVATVLTYGSIDAVSKLQVLIRAIDDMDAEIKALESKIREGNLNPSQDIYQTKAALVVKAAVDVRNQIRTDVGSEPLPAHSG